jgi:regulator of nucleoside diphosphate kinase
MNSKVRLKEDSGNVSEYTLVFPEDADFEQDKISVLSPVGCSIIGYKVGSTISIPSPKGETKAIVEEILYQPERSGDMDV